MYERPQRNGKLRGHGDATSGRGAGFVGLGQPFARARPPYLPAKRRRKHRCRRKRACPMTTAAQDHRARAASPGRSARQALRQACETAHARLDACFSRVELSSREGYCAFLTAHAAAFLPVELALERGGIAGLLPDWAVRRRGARLVGDLRALELATPPPAGTVCFARTADLLGGLYVLEGSRLGGTILRRQVPATLPASFLDAADSHLWRSLIVKLDAELLTDGEVDAAVDAALSVFQIYEISARQHLPP